MEPVKVAAVQAAPVLLDRDETIGKVVALAEKAAAEGARLVAFPEAFVPGYPDWVWRTRPWDAEATALYARLFDQAVTVGSPATDVIAETARRLQIWLSVGVDERDEAGSTIYNTLLHFAPDGPLAGRQEFDPVGHYNRPDVFRLHVDISPRPAVIETSDTSLTQAVAAPQNAAPQNVALQHVAAQRVAAHDSE
jgi:hypothetical protein